MNPSIIANGPLTVNEQQALWRYVSLPRLLLYLSGQLRLSTVQELRRMDPQEGVPAWDNITQVDAFSDTEYKALHDYVKSRLSKNDQDCFKINKNYSGANQQVIFRHWHNLVVTTRYALCFFASKHESIAMWRLFAPKGFAIRTSLPSLEKALQATNRKWRISRMKYLDKTMEITPDDTHHDAQLREILRYPHLLKSREYDYENEVRLCTVDAHARSSLVVDKVPPEDWIQELRISPDILDEDAEILRNLITERCPALAYRVGNSPIMTGANTPKSCFSDIEAEVSHENAEKNWPAFLHDP